MISIDKDMHQIVKTKKDKFIIIYNFKDIVSSMGFLSIFNNNRNNGIFNKKTNFDDLFNLTEVMLSDDNIYSNFF